MTPLLAFTATAAAAMLVPGPDTFVVLRASLAGGRAAATSATCCSTPSWC